MEKIFKTVRYGYDYQVKNCIDEIDKVEPIRNSEGETLLYVATYRDDAYAVRLLLEKGFDPNELSYDKATPLYNAVRHKNYYAVVLLLKHGADPNIKDETCNPLCLALSFEDIISVKLLIKHGADLSVSPPSDYALYNIARPKNIEIVRLILPSLVNLVKLHWVVAHGDCELVRLFLEHGARENIQTSLTTSIGIGNIDIVRTLLEYGANPTQSDSNGDTPLHKAARADSKEIITLLLRKGANPHAKLKSRSLYMNTPIDILNNRGMHDTSKYMQDFRISLEDSMRNLIIANGGYL